MSFGLFAGWKSIWITGSGIQNIKSPGPLNTINPRPTIIILEIKKDGGFLKEL